MRKREGQGCDVMGSRLLPKEAESEGKGPETSGKQMKKTRGPRMQLQRKEKQTERGWGRAERRIQGCVTGGGGGVWSFSCSLLL